MFQGCFKIKKFLRENLFFDLELDLVNQVSIFSSKIFIFFILIPYLVIFFILGVSFSMILEIPL